MSDEMVAWIREQLDEDERLARAAGGRFHGGHVWLVTDAERHPGLTGDQLGNVVTYGVPGGTLREHAAHIARHDPDRVLREVAAKRQILDEHKYFQVEHEAYGGCKTCSWRDDWEELHGEYPCATIRLLALPYSDSPGYRAEWRPSTKE